MIATANSTTPRYGTRYLIVLVALLLTDVHAQQATSGNVCAALPRDSPAVYKADVNCSIAVGCARSLCSCAGLVYDATLNDCVKPSTATVSSSTTCAVVQRCVAAAVGCFQQASVVAGQLQRECDAFAAPLHTQLLLAAMGADNVLVTDCMSIQCRLMNVTGLGKCNVTGDADVCPAPKYVFVEMGLLGASWAAVLASSASRVALFRAAIQQDISSQGFHYVIGDVTIANSTALLFNVTMSSASDIAPFLSVMSNSSKSSWTSTFAAYVTYGGTGALSLVVSRVIDPFFVAVPTAAPHATTSLPKSFTSANGTLVHTVSTVGGCTDVTCIVLVCVAAAVVAIGVVVATALVCERHQAREDLATDAPPPKVTPEQHPPASPTLPTPSTSSAPVARRSNPPSKQGSFVQGSASKYKSIAVEGGTTLP